MRYTIVHFTTKINAHTFLHCIQIEMAVTLCLKIQEYSESNKKTIEK